MGRTMRGTMRKGKGGHGKRGRWYTPRHSPRRRLFTPRRVPLNLVPSPRQREGMRLLHVAPEDTRVSLARCHPLAFAFVRTRSRYVVPTPRARHVFALCALHGYCMLEDTRCVGISSPAFVCGRSLRSPCLLSAPASSLALVAWVPPAARSCMALRAAAGMRMLCARRRMLLLLAHSLAWPSSAGGLCDTCRELDAYFRSENGAGASKCRAEMGHLRSSRPVR
ncbi:hypothetical protein FB451DRAFT_1295038 [Mycena latifolia]|nr:hypothetical protein FB451DRAFT_1295038 [Mycena latifolia]